MHASSLENMQKCYERFLARSVLMEKHVINVADIGGANINGSYADIFSDDIFNYIAVDMAAGEGVDIVADDPYKLPFENESIDVVISGQVMEHVEYFWSLFEEMVRILKRDGMLFIIVPSSGPIHRYPVDCYRFYPDSMKALAAYANVSLIDSWLDDRGPWNDLTAVFVKEKTSIRSERVINMPTNRFSAQYMNVARNDPGWGRENDIIRGGRGYLEVLSDIHGLVNPKLYLEIGVRNGESLSLAQCRAIGVDPDAQLNDDVSDNLLLVEMTSDEFFELEAESVFKDERPDLIFIDGMHLFEFVLRDFINVEQYSKPDSFVIIDDIFPNNSIQAERQRKSRVWVGDVWKIVDCLKTYRPELRLLPLDTSPTGLLLISGLNPENKVLKENYNPIVRKYISNEDADITPYLKRDGAYKPSKEIIRKYLAGC